MTKQEILSHIDHTLLKQFSTWEGIKKICDEAIEYKTASICIPPNYIKRVKDTYGDKVNICTVIGFPNGYNTTATKVFEAKEAIVNGANEVDMVINICDVKNGDFDKVCSYFCDNFTEFDLFLICQITCFNNDFQNFTLRCLS